MKLSKKNRLIIFILLIICIVPFFNSNETENISDQYIKVAYDLQTTNGYNILYELSTLLTEEINEINSENEVLFSIYGSGTEQSNRSNQYENMKKAMAYGASVYIVRLIDEEDAVKFIALAEKYDATLIFVENEINFDTLVSYEKTYSMPIDYEALYSQQQNLISNTQEVYYLGERFQYEENYIETTWDRTAVKEVMIEFLKVQPDAVIVCEQDIYTLGTYDAYKELELKTYNLIGFGNHPWSRWLWEQDKILGNVDLGLETIAEDIMNIIKEELK